MAYLIYAVSWCSCFAIADYLVGRDWKHLGWPTRSIYAVAPILILVFLWRWHGPAPDHSLRLSDWIVWVMRSGAPIPFGWALWRSVLGWSSFGGSMNPQNEAQVVAELIRNLVSSLFPMASLIVMGVHFIPAAFAMLLFALWATEVAIWYGAMTKQGKDVGPTVDALHGGGFGLIVALACVGANLPVLGLSHGT